MAAIEERTHLKGRLCFKVIRNGEVVREAKDNLIVTTGRNALAKLLSGQTGMHVAQVGVGSGSGAPAEDDTALTDSVTVNIAEARVGDNLEAEDGTVFSDARIVQFHFVFGTDVAVGLSISEYGLFCADGALFSRVVRETSFVKTNLDKIVGFWQITF